MMAMVRMTEEGSGGLGTGGYGSRMFEAGIIGDAAGAPRWQTNATLASLSCWLSGRFDGSRRDRGGRSFGRRSCHHLGEELEKPRGDRRARDAADLMASDWMKRVVQIPGEVHVGNFIRGV